MVAVAAASDSPAVVGTIPAPENFRKKLDRARLWAKADAHRQRQRSVRLKKVRSALRERTLGYEEEYAKEEQELVRLKREARVNGGFYRAPERKVVFCVRIRGVNKVPPTPRKIMQLLGLPQLHNGRFVRLNKATKGMLKRIEPYVTYGPLSRSAIRKLIYKRGYAKVGKPGAWSRKKISDIECVSKHLGKHNLHGAEDLVRQIASCGDKFKQANNFFWAFKLSSPKAGFNVKRHGFNEARGGDWGDRDTQMTALVSRMT